MESEEITLAAISRLVVKGSTGITAAVEKLLAAGEEPLTIINEGLVPGLNEVGRRYEEGTYYLPQLMLSAETAQKAFDLLETHMDQAETHQKGTMVIGTVKGDIHDIGKNMVAVMVKNHGYQVIDLGKNVPAEAFLPGRGGASGTVLGTERADDHHHAGDPQGDRIGTAAHACGQGHRGRRRHHRGIRSGIRRGRLRQGCGEHCTIDGGIGGKVGDRASLGAKGLHTPFGSLIGMRVGGFGAYDARYAPLPAVRGGGLTMPSFRSHLW